MKLFTTVFLLTTVKNWRDINGGDVNWHSLIPHNSIAWKISDRFKKRPDYEPEYLIKYRWSAMALGCVCDKGVRHWEAWPGWGKKTTEMFKSALRIIAKNPDAATHYLPADTFNPETD